MTIELLLENRTTGQIWDIAPCVQEILLTSSRRGKAGTLEFLLVANHISYVEGDKVRLSVDGQVLFLGWVFTKYRNHNAIITTICYDQIRYLNAKSSYLFYNRTASDMIAEIGKDMQLKLGELQSTGYVFPSLVSWNQSCLTLLEGALQETEQHTGEGYVLTDSPQGLCLHRAKDWMFPQSLGTGSILDYTYTTDIDQQTFNQIVVARKDRDGSMVEVMKENGDTQTKWGTLRLYQTVTQEVNDAQMTQQADALLAQYNRRLRQVRLTALGMVGLQAGQTIWIDIPNLGDMNLHQYVTLEQVVHQFSGGVHLMKLDFYVTGKE